MMTTELSNGLLGGIFIGSAAAVLLLFIGEIMGFSGIVSSILLNPWKAFSDDTQYWRLLFLLSFAATAQQIYNHHESDLINVANQKSTLAYVLGGLFVGFGTKLGNGCTSGHGICGLGRRSPRSFAAVLTFMATAILTTYFVSNKDVFRAQALEQEGNVSLTIYSMLISHYATMIVFILALLAPFLFHNNDSKTLSGSYRKILPSILSAILFAAGLWIGGMVNPRNIMAFLNVTNIFESDETWDPSLVAVMGGGAAVSFLSYQFVDGFQLVSSKRPATSQEPQPSCGLTQPLALKETDETFQIPTNKIIDSNLIIGAAFFGIGWSLTGMCPAPALFLAAAGIPQVLFQWWPAYVVGAHAAQSYKSYMAR